MSSFTIFDDNSSASRQPTGGASASAPRESLPLRTVYDRELAAGKDHGNEFHALVRRLRQASNVLADEYCTLTVRAFKSLIQEWLAFKRTNLSKFGRKVRLYGEAASQCDELVRSLRYDIAVFEGRQRNLPDCPHMNVLSQLVGLTSNDTTISRRRVHFRFIYRHRDTNNRRSAKCNSDELRDVDETIVCELQIVVYQRALSLDGWTSR